MRNKNSLRLIWFEVPNLCLWQAGHCTLQKKSKTAAFKYLIKKQKAGKKGKNIKYEELQIADYLLPDSKATMEEKFDIFALRTEMNDLPHNFGRSEECKFGCKEDMTNSHIFMCQNPDNSDLQKLQNGNVEEKVKALRIFQKNLTHFFEEE